jgi:nitroreductase
MNTLLNELVKRRARRALDQREIPEDVLERVMRAASLAPSCSNNQPWRFVAVREKAKLDEVKSFLTPGNAWAKRSPCIILAATKPEFDCRLDAGREYALFDTGQAVMALQIQAIHEGLYVHPIAGFNALGVKKAAGIPDDVVLITLVILGYPGELSVLDEANQAKEVSERQRKPMNEVAVRDAWTFP